MKQIISMFITLVIGLIVAYFASNLNKEFVDLRYTISEKIPTKYIESSTAETVQQLVVKNNGNIPAEKTQIKIKGEIVEYDILKNSVSDKVEEHYSNGHFEAIYPSLPPGAQFSYIFKTSGMGLTKSLIEITHNKGKGTEALSSDVVSTASKVGSFATLALVIFYVVLLVIQGRSIAIDRLESSGSYTGFYEYLSKSKPFYVSQEKWNSIRRKYIEKMSKVENFHLTDIEELESYKILNQDKPGYLSVDEWELLKEKTMKSLVDFMSYSIKTSSHFNNLSKYFTIKKPVHFPDNQWKEIAEDINNNFIVSRKLNERFYISSEEIIKELNVGMPNGMSPVHWANYKEYLLKRYYEIICRKILREWEPIVFLRDVDLSILEKEQQNSLNDLAYKIQLTNFDNISSIYEAEHFLKGEKPEWIKSEDLTKLVKRAEKYTDLENLITRYQSLLGALHNIANKIPLKEKPDDIIKDKEWNDIKELEHRTAAIAIEIEEDKAELEISKEETKKLKNKILQQLEIVNNILTEPNSIDRIEPYNNPFSKGNFENLQKISNLLNN
ncbi:hypothetical protein [Alteromonas stellipolaris]|uniref:hypothetical protein n=1 Tax=Alteromonas stellipolaris TaxID=233316 RepID=UPI0024953751|nr:hypothetical protein [Alteromonas stellipolaris]